MKIIYGINKIKKFKHPVVALGVFDGVHRGHRLILKATVRKARQIKGTSVVVTFFPHPQAQKSLYSLAHRLRLIAELGIDVCIVIKFNPAFAKISARNFIKNILSGKIGAKYIYVGRNFRFGKAAEGDFRLLKKLSQVFNYQLKLFEVIKAGNKPISSTYIRELITKGRLLQAQSLLQRPVTVLGTVIKGISLARKMGFPTANIDPHHEIHPPSGVYAVRVVLGNQKFSGVCNIGKKPTLLIKHKEEIKGAQKHIEVYIFNFNKNIYARDLAIEFVRKVREEKRFQNIRILTGQIKKDIQAAKNILSRH